MLTPIPNDIFMSAITMYTLHAMGLWNTGFIQKATELFVSM